MIRVSTLLLLLFLLGDVSAQDLEPRRWTPVPAGVNIVGAGYVAVQGDVYFDPVLDVQDADVSGHVVGVSYVRSFAIGNKLARFDAKLPWQNMRWSGLLNGEPASTERVGLADPVMRMSVILAGASADRKATAETKPSSTVFGVAIAVSLPLGEYHNDKLINLGRNRAYVRPQMGVLHTRGRWSFELTGSTFIFEANDDFFGGASLEQEPLYAVQGHIIRVFDKPGYWGALSAGHGWKGESMIDDTRADDSKNILLWSLAFGMPTGNNHGLKFAYISNRTKTDKGADTDSLAVAWSYRF